MADLATQLSKARSEGHPDAAIVTYLAKDPALGPKVRFAREQKWPDKDIVDFLARPAPAAPAPAEGNPLARLGSNISRRGNEGLADVTEGGRQFVAGLGANGDRMDVLGGGLRVVGGGLKAAFSPISGYVETGAGPAWKAATGFPESSMGDFSDNMLSLAAGPKGAPNPLKAVATRAPVRASARLPTAKPTRADVVAQFDRAEVQPSLAAVDGGYASTAANFVAENPVGGNARANLAAERAQAGAKARKIASGYGANRGPQIAGERVQEGVRRFAKGDGAPTPADAIKQPARATSFKAKAGAVYDDVFDKLDAAMAGKTVPGRAAIIADDQFPQKVVVGGSQIETPATARALVQNTQSAAIGDLIKDPTLSRAAKALQSADAAKDMSFSDLRRLRTWVRDAKANPELRASIGDANLNRLDGALTQDIFANAEKLGSPELATRLRRADKFYALGSERITTALDKFDNVRGNVTGESTFKRVRQAAESGSGADAKSLVALKRSLAPDEWGDVVATVVTDMGKPTKAGADALDHDAFSFNVFTSSYAGLSERGREVLFGPAGGGGKKAVELKAELDNLAGVVARLKGVEKGANASKTGVSMQGVNTLAAVVQSPFTGTVGPVLAGLAGLRLTGTIMTNPNAVRFLANLTKAKAVSEPAFARQVARLEAAAKRDASLTPLVDGVRALVATPQPIKTPALSQAAAEPEKPAS